jgi:hypothetical protein
MTVSDRVAPRRRAPGRRRRPKTVEWQRPYYYPAQSAFLLDPARFVMVEASTKTGKTSGCIAAQTEDVLFLGAAGRSFWWVAPVYGQAEIAYNRLRHMATPGLFRFNDSKLKATCAVNGADWFFRSAEKPDNLYGDDVWGVTVDEASRVREASWTALYSTLTATGGRARIIGNVKGRRNWFYKLARRAQAGEPDHAYHKLTAWDAVAGGIIERSVVEAAQRDLAPDVFAELYLAEASAAGANPFGTDVVARLCRLAPPGPDGRVPGTDTPVVFGVDLGKVTDSTVVTGLDTAGRTAYWERFRLPWTETVVRLVDILQRFPGAFALTDGTGAGDAPSEFVSRKPGLAGRVESFQFTGRSHQQIYEGLALDMGSGSLPALTRGVGDCLFEELDNFTFEHRRTGVHYTAPEGMHDDAVASLALAAEARRRARLRPSGLSALVAL